MSREARLNWEWATANDALTFNPAGLDTVADCDIALAAIDRLKAGVLAYRITLTPLPPVEEPPVVIPPVVIPVVTPLTPTPSSITTTAKMGQKGIFPITLKKGGDDVHVWEPKTSEGWLTTTPGYGSINRISTETDTLTVKVDTAADMKIGPNKGLVYVWDTAPGFSRLITIPITITVTNA